MLKARAFFYVCAGIFLLALAYHFGAQSATAQAPANPVVGVAADGYGIVTVVTYNGDVYRGPSANGWLRIQNVFSGTTPATQETWGGVKARYRPEGAAKQAKDR